MAESNHEALGRGLKLYIDAMRELIKQRLVASFPSTWWEDGVLKAVSEGQRNQLRRDVERNPRSDKVDFLEAAILVPVITRNFDRAFKDVFANYRQAQSWLTQVAEARNTWAHPRSGDMLADEVGYYLYAMQRLLSEAGLAEAEQLEALRKDVLGMPHVAPDPVQVLQSASTPPPQRKG